MKPKYQEYAERSTRKKMVLMPGFREGDVLTVKAESRENGLQVGWTVMVAEDQTTRWVRVWFGSRHPRDTPESGIQSGNQFCHDARWFDKPPSPMSAG